MKQEQEPGVTELETATCQSKRGYATMQAALLAARKGAKTNHHACPYRAYQCPVCRQYHLSSAPKRKGKGASHAR